MKWVVRGRFKMGGGWTTFTKEVEAPSEKLAREYVYSIIGSNHKTMRKHIIIEEVRRCGSEAD